MDALTDKGLVFPINLYGTVRGKTVASLAHMFALITIKLDLPNNTVDPPWKLTGKPPQDYFKWRKAMVAEANDIAHTLTELFGGMPLATPKVPWTKNGRDQVIYVPGMANSFAQDYAKTTVKALGLTNE